MSLQSLICDSEEHIQSQQEKAKQMHKKLTKSFKENQNRYAFIKGYKELQEVSKASEIIYKQELEEKLMVFNKTLQKNTTSFLRQYEHIQEIYIDENHSIVINDGAKTLDTELLSAGQKQVLNFLIVKSILEFKKFSSFVMVDTPFGRLSSANRKLLLKECYLKFDHLILLLTDSEYEFIQNENLECHTYNLVRQEYGSTFEKVS